MYVHVWHMFAASIEFVYVLNAKVAIAVLNTTTNIGSYPVSKASYHNYTNRISTLSLLSITIILVVFLQTKMHGVNAYI